MENFNNPVMSMSTQRDNQLAMQAGFANVQQTLCQGFNGWSMGQKEKTEYSWSNALNMWKQYWNEVYVKAVID